MHGPCHEDPCHEDAAPPAARPLPPRAPGPAPRPAWIRTALLVLLALAGAARGQDGQRDDRTDKTLIAAFEKAFAPHKRGRPAVALPDREAAFAAVEPIDSAAVAAALASAFCTLEAELQQIEAERLAANKELEEILAGQLDDERRQVPPDKRARYGELRDLVLELRDRGDGLRPLQQRIGDRIAALRDPGALEHLLDDVLPQRKDPLPLRLCAGRAVGAGAVDLMDRIGRALARARDPVAVLALLDAVGIAGTTARLHAGAVIAHLSHDDEVVRERAALALARVAVPEAIEPMIALLERSSGQTRVRVASALEVLTGQQHGVNTGAWRAWWNAAGRDFAAGGAELGKGTPSHRKQTNQNYYFGIPQDQSDSILYVIDCSGSMKAPVDFKTPGTTAGGEAKKQSRLDACKAELISALGRLAPTQRFAILWYNDLPHWWEPKLQPAEPKTVQRAQEFVRTLGPASSTNIHDSLELGFTLVGRGARDKYYGVDIDTVFLLTDGSPTRPDGQLDSTEKILVGVRSWNALKRVTIHTIGIGKGLNEPFLAQLARENGGEFKKF